MQPRRQRHVTIVFGALLLVAFGVRTYFNTREEFRLVEELMPFSITNDVVSFKYWRGDFARTNAQLVTMLQQSQNKVAVVTMRVRLRGGTIEGWRAVDFAITANSIQPR